MPMNPRLLRPIASGGFTPAKIADLGLWLDASVTSSLTFNGSTVSEWRDLSGNGRHFAQATAGSQPTGDSRTENGKRVLDFDGADVLSGNAAALSLGRNVGALTLIAVAGSDAGGGNRELFNVTRSGGTQARFALINVFDTPVRGVLRRTDADSAALLDAAVASTLTPRLFSLVGDYANGDGFMFLDGAAAASSTSLTSNGNTSDTNSDAVNLGNIWDGFIAEVCVFRRAVTTAERQKVEGYLAWKWGLQAQLPYDHPYAKSFPGFGSQATPTDADTLTYLAAVKAADGTGVEVGVANAVDAFVTGCKADGIWDAIKASCILAGARTLAGALVPLKPLGPELWSVSTPAVFDFASGSSGAWDGATLTMSNGTTGSDATFPRFRFTVPIVAGRRYRVTGRLSGDTDAIGAVRLATSGFSGYATYNSSTGEISGTVTAVTANLEFFMNGTLGAKSVTIESLSIREDFAPTNNNFVSGDYNRETGLKGDGSTKYLDSNRANDDDPQDDKHLSVYRSVAATNNGGLLGSNGTTTGHSHIYTGFGSFNFRMNAAASATQSLSLNTGAAFLGASRNAAASFGYRISGTGYTATVTSETPNGNNIRVFETGGKTDARIAFYSIGEVLDLAALDTRVSALVTAIGNAI